jgi:hypothetical protein
VTPDGLAMFALSLSAAVQRWDRVKWAPNGSKLAFAADPGTEGYAELYIASPDGLAVQPLTDNGPARRSTMDIAWSSDSSEVVFRVYENDFNQISIYRTQADGTARYFLGQSLTYAAVRIPAQWISNRRIAFVADLNVALLGELFVADDMNALTPVSGSFATVLLSGTGVIQFAEIPLATIAK